MDENSSLIPVRFEPSGPTVHVPPGALLVEAAAQAGLELQMPCGGEGLCGKCRVRLLKGAGTPTDQEKRRFSAEELKTGWRLACQTPVRQALVVHVPEATLAQTAAKILLVGQVLADFPIQPPVVKRFVVLPPPSRQDDKPDIERLARALQPDSPNGEERPTSGEKPLRADWPMLRQLPDRIRQCGFQGTAVLADNCLL
ncbi:MAG TPA: 2Fe-2S iron-sulfur cluster-binding protein, partial [Thermoguttaceae bacterium]|nr:2Fe-2S iron-sulfur cluster-binding protein [Thermoguttaceae bacterium]